MVWPLLDQTLIDHAPRDGGHLKSMEQFLARELCFAVLEVAKANFV